MAPATNWKNALIRATVLHDSFAVTALLFCILASILVPSVSALRRTLTAGCQECQSGTSSNCSADNCTAGWCLNVTAGCYPCRAGSVAPAGSANCSVCPAGTFASIDHCEGCPPGSWSTGAVDRCSPCGFGKYNTQYNLTTSASCIECPPGYFCPSEFNPFPRPCPANYKCTGSNVSPTHCEFLFVSPSSSSSCSPSTLFWSLIALGAGLIIVLALLLLMRLTKRSRDQQERLSRERETDALIPKPVGGPVYGGY